MDKLLQSNQHTTHAMCSQYSCYIRQFKSFCWHNGCILSTATTTKSSLPLFLNGLCLSQFDHVWAACTLMLLWSGLTFTKEWILIWVMSGLVQGCRQDLGLLLLYSWRDGCCPTPYFAGCSEQRPRTLSVCGMLLKMQKAFLVEGWN